MRMVNTNLTMGKIEMESNHAIPTVDMSSFFHEGNNVDDQEKAAAIIGEACRSYGFFRMVNHGMPKSLMARALQLSKEFFNLSDEEKLEIRSVGRSAATLPAGYDRQPEGSLDRNEYFMVFSPELGHNLYPTNLPEFRSIMEDCFAHLGKTSILIEEILNKVMGLPPNYLREYNKDHSIDFLAALRYFPATNSNENSGISEHQDGNLLTFVFQDDVCGLEVLKDGYWIPVQSIEGSIIVNVGDIIQVLSNNEFHSATHRVVRGKRDRYSFAFFFHHVEEGKWVEPLPQFTSEIKEPSKYRKFLYKEYIQLRMMNKTHPPFFRRSCTQSTEMSAKDSINISYYAIDQNKVETKDTIVLDSSALK